jgi:hypothetical protein
MKLSSKFTATGASDAPISNAEFIQILKRLIIPFSYAWWVVIIVYYGVIDDNATLSYKLLSLPIIATSLALIEIYKVSVKSDNKLVSYLCLIGLFVSGLLA